MDNPCKYFSYKEGPYWRVNDLLPVSQIRSMLVALEWKHEVFASIQTYDEHANIQSCPFYFDLDGKPEEVLSETRHLVQALEFFVNVTPRIYFSGNKGFHIIIEKTIAHPRCHELMRSAALDIASGLKTLDHKVYRTRSMFRIPGSKASKPGYYKIEISRPELFNNTFESIRQLATTQRMMKTEHDPSKFNDDQFEAWMKVETERLPKLQSLNDIVTHNQTVAMEVTPCISRMLLAPAIEGERNMTIYVLGQFFRSCEIDEDSAKNIILAQPHHATFEAETGEVSKVLQAVYRSRQPAMVGCKSSSPYAQLMRGYCAAPCHFREDFEHTPWRKFPQ